MGPAPPTSSTTSILVYDGAGVSRDCLLQTLSCLQTHLSPNSTISRVYAQDLAQPDWMASTRLLVIPGGRDLPYVQDLQPQATDYIREFVYQGGLYLGLCAGAYFATKRVEFELDRPDYRIVGDRHLALIDAIGRGAAFPGYVYGTEHGARAAPMQMLYAGGNTTESMRMYFNGGAYFSIIDESNVEILATYQDGRPAIVMSRFGRGRALLSGVHFEFDPETMSSTAEIIDQLRLDDQKRIQFLSDLRSLMNL